MWTEAAIKSCLDGTFTKVTHAGDVVRREVPKDWIPPYNAAPKLRSQASLGRGVPRKPWTPEEDQKLARLRSAGLTWDVISHEMRRGIKQVRIRLRDLQAGEVTA